MKPATFKKVSIFVVILASFYVLWQLLPGAMQKTYTNWQPATTTPPSLATTTAVLSAVINGFTPIKAPGGIIKAIVASTSAEEAKGLSGRDALPADQGMIFLFDKPGNYGFWMPDMKFAIDMIWIKADKTVAGITSDVLPDSYPTVFFPPTPISYVLELTNGGAARFGIATGTQLVF